MSSQPECRKCGYYVHSGLVVCEECSGILADEMKAISAENARLAAELAAAREERDSLAILANALWPVLEGMYGCDGPQNNLPIELIPEDLRQLFNKLLEVAGERT